MKEESGINSGLKKIKVKIKEVGGGGRCRVNGRSNQYLPLGCICLLMVNWDELGSGVGITAKQAASLSYGKEKETLGEY